MRLTSLSGMKRLHACSSAASRRRARDASVGWPPTTITWADEPITGKRISAAMALGVGDGESTCRGTVVGTGIADQVGLGRRWRIVASAGRRSSRSRRRADEVAALIAIPPAKAGEGDTADHRDRTPRPSGGMRIDGGRRVQAWPCQAVDVTGRVVGDELSSSAAGHRGSRGRTVRAAEAHRSPSR